MIVSQGGRDLKDLTASTLSGRELREAWSEWLNKVFLAEPLVLSTLTFATRPWESGGTPGISRVQRAARKYARVLTRALARPSFFVVMERGSWNGRAHLHSLISCTDKVAIQEAQEAHRVREGFVKLSARAGSVQEYVTKYLSKSDQDFWLAGGPLFESPDVDVVRRGGNSFRGGGRSARMELVDG